MRLGYNTRSLPAVAGLIAGVVAVVLAAALDLGDSLAGVPFLGTQARHALQNGLPPSWVLCHSLSMALAAAFLVEGIVRSLRLVHWPVGMQWAGCFVWFILDS